MRTIHSRKDSTSPRSFDVLHAPHNRSFTIQRTDDHMLVLVDGQVIAKIITDAEKDETAIMIERFDTATQLWKLLPGWTRVSSDHEVHICRHVNGCTFYCMF